MPSTLQAGSNETPDSTQAFTSAVTGNSGTDPTVSASASITAEINTLNLEVSPLGQPIFIW